MRQAKLLPRCIRCGAAATRCICSSTEALKTRTKVVVIMHVFELKKPSNSARLLPVCLENAEVLVRGEKDRPMPTASLEDPDRELWVLFPSDDSEPLTQALVDSAAKPITLVVPDGTWPQARRIPNRVKELKNARRVRLAEAAPATMRLRHHPDPARMSTAEAVGRALAVIEGPEAGKHVEDTFHRFATKLLEARGAFLPKLDDKAEVDDA